MAAWHESGDPHGYERLRDALLSFATELTTTGNDSESEIWIAPSRSTAEGRRQRMTAVVAEIDGGFRAVGGG